MVLFHPRNCQRGALWLRQKQKSPPGSMLGGLAVEMRRYML
ncbi:hypothetical protein [Acidovorax sp. LjRoot194]